MTFQLPARFLQLLEYSGQRVIPTSHVQVVHMFSYQFAELRLSGLHCMSRAQFRDNGARLHPAHPSCDFGYLHGETYGRHIATCSRLCTMENLCCRMQISLPWEVPPDLNAILGPNEVHSLKWFPSGVCHSLCVTPCRHALLMSAQQ